MHCRGCGHENRAGRRFCAGCGAALESACPKCGFANLPGERFCGGCGAGLDEATRPGERRQVAILFADLAGYTRLSTSLDPEEVHRLLTGFFEVVDGACARFGATIDKHIGDNVMAIFGAPVAHGDDPERAVRAAVTIHREVAAYSARVGRELKVHIGIAYGEVMASGLGSSHHTEYTVTGDAVNLAARLQDKAVGGETLVSDPVFRAAARIAVAESVGDVDVKGLAAPVAVWKVTDVRVPASTAKLIGRDAEMAAIAARLDAEGGALIIVRGDPGIGKSTLVAVAARAAAERGFDIVAAHVLDFGTARGAGPIATLVAGLLDAPGDDDGRRIALDLAVRTGRVDPLDANHLSDLLELISDDSPDLDSRDRAARQLEALAALIASAPRRPLAVVEDVHWADPATLVRLRRVAEALVARGGALLATTRIDGDPFDSGWRDFGAHALDLEPLSSADAARIAADTLADADLVARCVERAAGNPLFLEQLVHAATRDAFLPGTVQGVVLARVDRLAPRDRTALQAASIAGQRFTLALVRHLAHDAGWLPDEAIARRLLRVVDDELAFHHALILDGIYASITHGRRRDLHRAAAAWFAGRDLDLHAEHLERASDPAAAAAWLAAAERHVELHAFDRAIALYARGVEIAASTADRNALHAAAGRLQLELGDITGSAAAWAAALEHAPDDGARCTALIGLAGAQRLRHDPGAGLPLLEQAEALANAAGRVREQAEIAYLRGSFAFGSGDSQCGDHHQRALALARQAGDDELAIRALSGIGDSLYGQTRFAEAAVAFAECVRLCEERGMRRYALPNRAMIGDCKLFLGDWRTADRILVDVAAEAQTLRAARSHALALESLAFERGLAWRDTELEAILPEARRVCEAYGFHSFMVQNLLLEAELAASRRDRPRVLELLADVKALGPVNFTDYARSLELHAAILGSDDREERRRMIRRFLDELHVRSPLGRIMFYRNVIEYALREDDLDLIPPLADALEAVNTEPLMRFVVDRARFLVARRRGEANEQELARLHELAARAGFGPCLPPLQS
jgi:class 3 adenylate cyclase/tetratricopeptide (TPR) repeat protein